MEILHKTLHFPEFPGPSRFRMLGFPFSAFWGEMKLIMLGSAELFLFRDQRMIRMAISPVGGEEILGQKAGTPYSTPFFGIFLH